MTSLCRAIKPYAGSMLVCTRERDHEGDHASGGFTWETRAEPLNEWYRRGRPVQPPEHKATPIREPRIGHAGQTVCTCGRDIVRVNSFDRDAHWRHLPDIRVGIYGHDPA